MLLTLSLLGCSLAFCHMLCDCLLHCRGAHCNADGIMAVAITPNIKVAAVMSSNFYVSGDQQCTFLMTKAVWQAIRLGLAGAVCRRFGTCLLALPSSFR